jgi:hypothetical protein
MGTNLKIIMGKLFEKKGRKAIGPNVICYNYKGSQLQLN